MNSFNDYLKGEVGDTPRSLQDLAQCGVRLVLGDTADPDAVGFKQWRTAFYVAGETETAVTNFLLLLDGFLAWKGRQLAREQPFEVHLYPHISAKSAAVDAWDQLEGCEYTRMQPALRLPLGFFEAQPVQGKRVVTFRLELDDGKLSALIVGNTYNYRTKLDEAGVLGGYSEAENSAAGTPRTYYRVLQNLDVSSQNDRDRLLEVFKTCFNNLALRIVWDSPQPEADTPAAEFLAALQEMPQLHFTD